MKKFIFFVLAALLMNSINAQVSFSNEKLIFETQTKGLKDIALSDLNDDGKIDILSASSSDHKIAWYQNLESGGFSQQIVISDSLHSATIVMSEDLDMDGLHDVIAAGKNTVSWFKNLGNGNFSNAVTISDSVNEPEDMAVADFNSDGLPDIVIALAKDNKIVWYENLGNGSLSFQKVISSTANKVNSVFALDINGDSFQDIVSYSVHDQKIELYEGNGNGMFSNPNVISDTAIDYYDITITDFNNDNYPDICFIDETGIFLYKNNGSGGFHPQDTIYLSSSPLSSYYSTIGSGDLDGNGHLDIIYANEDRVGYFPNSGQDFGSFVLITDSIQFSEVLLAGNLKGDSLPEVVLASSDDRITWYQNDSITGFGKQKVLVDYLTNIHDFSIGDISGDGIPDVISAANYPEVSWYENKGHGVFGNQNVISHEPSAGTAVNTADIDGDGNLDVVIVSGHDDKIAWHENQGGGNFTSQKIISDSLASPWALFTVDLNNDNYPDVLSASYVGDKLVWFENFGNASFSSAKTISSNLIGCMFLFASDLNGNGLPDVVASATTSDSVMLYMNLGSGNFNEILITDTLIDPGMIKAADLNGDNNKDLVIRHDKGVTWYQNDGTANFISSQNIYTGQYFLSNLFSIDDMDNDGTNDIIYSDSTNHLVLLNDGTGNFSSCQVPTFGITFASDSETGDINNDGKPDVILYVFEKLEKLVWYSNWGATGIALQTQDDIKTYPNPGGDYFNLDMPIGKGTLRVFNQNGQLLFEQPLTKGRNKIDMKPYASGIYYLRLTNEQNRNVGAGKWIKL